MDVLLAYRFLYLRLMLHRPILTDLSAAYARPHRDATGSPSTEAPPRSQGKGLRAPFLTECARVCVDAAMQLIDLVQGSYQTDTTGAWWWNSLCEILLPISFLLFHPSQCDGPRSV